MKTAENGSAPTSGIGTSISKDSTWRPKALRRTVTSIPPIVSWCGAASRIRSASRIMPAQDP